MRRGNNANRGISVFYVFTGNARMISCTLNFHKRLLGSGEKELRVNVYSM